ncbi:Ribonucleoside-diphosphate reductase, beta chain [Candidatus Phytoplasma mali]|uniref:ribonucleoside-diphosphate reductase n=1 Tax=Phytoplasma mali (strain AT) TaxID=482235 RepID=B3R0K9_PHYMT|nr:class 1b ribonucleoside-diphosphate reductase subunit beta [Candidatus Phytoplasma mali]CAP18373.1 Ribonucleoside-diphosphate reductase, beta chain [Candidatus Phytoplasma mali]
MKNKDINYIGANWNQFEDPYTHFFYEQNLSQFWRPEDISLQGDLQTWKDLSKFEKNVYSKNLLILTFLDTYQGDSGMFIISSSFKKEEHQKKATLNFMGAMENAVHAKSYSNIFMTLLNSKEIDDLFVWGGNQKYLQNIIGKIIDVYEDLEKKIFQRKYNDENITDLIFKKYQWKAMVTSVFLETWLFYSGFYYPLFFYSQGKLMQSGEIINLIIRDESVHGVYIARLALNIYNSFDKLIKDELSKWMYDLLKYFYQEQIALVKSVYNEHYLINDVNKFVRYNANKALMNLGFNPYFEKEEVNPVILNGLNTETKTMDNFSMKGNGYQKMRSESLQDSDFVFVEPKIN